jgi:serine/threonine protein kinase/formylglycine-generating enzyme required for sulfatase activity
VLSDGDFELPDEDEIDATLLRRIDRICTEFDRQWRAGLAPRIENFLEQVPAAGRNRGLRELIIVEIDLLRETREAIAIDGYLARFPGQEALVKKAFMHDEPTRIVPPLSPEAQTPQVAGSDPADNVRSHLGRFQVRDVIGKGTFGIVYLAIDPQFPRLVALKVPRAERLRTEEQRLAFIRDAQIAAELNHPGVVTIYEIDTTGPVPFIVEEYMPGGDLKRRLAEGRQSCEQSVAWMITIAEAVAAAHQKNTFHRDLKPANILLDERDQPRVADFGLALRERDQQNHRGEFAGTLSYMSPEQVRRESNRLDGRTDTWSLGVILYEMLTGRRPFLGSEEEVREQIKHRDPRPLRELNDQLPPELERICLKCLEKPVGRRYSTAHDLAKDLGEWQLEQRRKDHEHRDVKRPQKDGIKSGMEEPVATKHLPRIVPKGLRSFDARDADFFLELLPGPRDRHGLPESVRFWKALIEETDSSQTFPVGVLHGPSGCGKSSFLKAGVLPKLADHVAPVFVEATAADTEVRLLRGLRKLLPDIPHDLPLPDVLAGIRDGTWNSRRKKVLIVLDQFEQWLHAGNLLGSAQLVDALRHCDGDHLQCLVLVREDFWTGISRFMQQLEIPIQEQRNAALVDRFDAFHARRVLEHFGRAYERLPEKPAALSPEQEQFLDAAIEQLSEEGRVICVRLALFSDLIKGKPWTQAALRQAGGADGLGVAFLEETFASKTAPEAHRRHCQAVQKLFGELLPEADTDIKGSMQTRDDLQRSCGYADKPREFDELIRILDEQLRLVTPTDPEGRSEPEKTADATAAAPPQFYQFTHDFLVPSVRRWLTLKDAETAAGRARQILNVRAIFWSSRPEARHLPSFSEFLSIRFRTAKNGWTRKQTAMMNAASRHFGARGGGIALAILIIAVFIQQFMSNQQRSAVRSAVDSLQTTAGSGVPFAIRNLERYPRGIVLDELRIRYAKREDPQRLPILYALAAFDQVHVEELIDAIRDAGPNECDNLVDALARDQESGRQQLTAAAQTATDEDNWLLKTRLATVALHLGDSTLAADMLRAEPVHGDEAATWDPIQRTLFIELFPKWTGDVPNLAKMLRDTTNPSLRSGIALAIGGTEQQNRASRESWKRVFEGWYLDARDAGTHGAAAWALREWGVPEIPSEKRQRADCDWQLTKLGLTMIRIPAGEFWTEDDQIGRRNQIRVKVDDEFWISDREVSVGLFQQFLGDPEAAKREPDWTGADPQFSPTSNHPMQRVNWYDCIEFCNWLSDREECHPCYEKHGAETILGETDDAKRRAHDSWTLRDAADGYRLPTGREWEYACRAGAATDFFFGNNVQLLNRYALFQEPTGPLTIGSLRCNPWGLFDIHGNVKEWCQTEILSPTGQVLKMYRGGSWAFSAEYSRSATNTMVTPILRATDLGFRVVRVLRPGSKDISIRRENGMRLRSDVDAGHNQLATTL